MGISINVSDNTFYNEQDFFDIGLSGNPQKFDERKSVQADGINRVTVNSYSTDIIISSGDTNCIDAHFYGEAFTSGKASLDITKNGREVTVTLDIDSCNKRNGPTLLVTIPTRKFETLSATSHNGSVKVEKDVYVKKIRLVTHNGNVESEGKFSEISAITHNGDTYVYVSAESDVEIDAVSHNGDVTVQLENIATSNISMHSRNGNVRNRFCRTNGSYTAYGRAESYKGNVTVN